MAAVIGLRNRAVVFGQAPHLASSGAATAQIGLRLTARASGIFMICFGATAAAAAAADQVSWLVNTYTDSVPGTPLTLPANALAAGTNCYIDNSGAGIAPLAGSTGGNIETVTYTLGTGATGTNYAFAAMNAVNGVIVPLGTTFYATLGFADTVAARALTNCYASAFEMA